MSGGPTTTTNQSQNQNQSIRAPGFIEAPLRRGADAAFSSFSGVNTPTVESAGRNLTERTLQGDFLSPDSNPFLQQTFDRGANLITNRLNTNFARSGRNTAAGRPAAADELGSFAAQLFGGNFQRERDRQTSALGTSSQFNPIDQFINRLTQLSSSAGRDVTGNSTSTSRTKEKKGGLDTVLDIAGLFA